jgi:hypothetical protein
MNAFVNDSSDETKAYRRGHGKMSNRDQIEPSAPEELDDADLLMSECLLTTTAPVPFRGKPDQVWKVGTRIIVSDTKRRERLEVRPEDIVQISTYRMMLMQNFTHPKWEFPRYGYVRIEHAQTNEVVWVKVATLSERQIVRAWFAYHQVDAEAKRQRRDQPLA